MKRPLSYHVRRGFTLIEVLMSAFVLALGSLGLLALFAGAASQQRASGELTDSVTLSKNAEAIIKTKVENFGTDTVLGCFSPSFSPDAWYALPANPEFGFLTINPTNRPGSSALYFEAAPRGGVSPITLYRAGAPGGLVPTGVASLSGINRAPFTNGTIPLNLNLPDRRLLLKGGGGDDLVVTFDIFEIGCDPDDNSTILDSAGTRTYSFRGDCDDADTNVVFLGDGVQPMNTSQDHVRVNTEIIPVDGTDPARLISFRINEIERPDQQATMFVDTVTGTIPVGPFPECRTSVSPNFFLVSWLDTNNTGTGPALYRVTTAANADYISIPDPRTSGTTALFNVPTSDLTGLDAANTLGVGLRVGTQVPIGAVQPQGPFLIQKPTFVNVAVETTFYGALNPTFYALTPEVPGDPVAGNLEDLLYPSKIVNEIRINYKRRADELVSLNDRIQYTTDANYRNGRRPSMAYSVLYRDRGGRASDQFVVFTYTLAPSRTDAEWFPPETAEQIEDGEAPLRRAREIPLAYDRSNERWLLNVPDDEAWMASPGQLLYFAGVGRSDGAIIGPGAETAVRVVSVEQRELGRHFLILDGPPRSGGANLLDVHYSGADMGVFDVWGIQTEVRSEADDSIWTLKPIEARAFQAGGGS